MRLVTEDVALPVHTVSSSLDETGISLPVADVTDLVGEDIGILKDLKDKYDMLSQTRLVKLEYCVIQS